MPIYEVTIVQTLEGKIYVEADSKAEAQDVADGIGVECDDELDCETTITEVGIDAVGRRYWSGGS